MTAPNFIGELPDEYELELRIKGLATMVDFFFDGAKHFIRVANADAMFRVIPRFNGELYQPVFPYDDFIIVSVYAAGSFKFNVPFVDVQAGKYVILLKYVSGGIEAELVEDVS